MRAEEEIETGQQVLAKLLLFTPSYRTGDPLQQPQAVRQAKQPVDGTYSYGSTSAFCIFSLLE
jgi:hypothetical protein